MTVALGVFVLIIGAIWLVDSFRFTRGARQTTATIVDDPSRAFGPDPSLSARYYCFKDHTGTLRTVRSHAFLLVPLILVPGSHVQVSFHPDSPEKARLCDPIIMWVVPSLVLASGALISIL